MGPPLGRALPLLCPRHPRARLGRAGLGRALRGEGGSAREGGRRHGNVLLPPPPFFRVSLWQPAVGCVLGGIGRGRGKPRAHRARLPPPGNRDGMGTEGTRGGMGGGRGARGSRSPPGGVGSARPGRADRCSAPREGPPRPATPLWERPRPPLVRRRSAPRPSAPLFALPLVERGVGLRLLPTFPCEQGEAGMGAGPGTWRGRGRVGRCRGPPEGRGRRRRGNGIKRERAKRSRAVTSSCRNEHLPAALPTPSTALWAFRHPSAAAPPAARRCLCPAAMATATSRAGRKCGASRRAEASHSTALCDAMAEEWLGAEAAGSGSEEEEEVSGIRGADAGQSRAPRHRALRCPAGSGGGTERGWGRGWASPAQARPR